MVSRAHDVLLFMLECMYVTLHRGVPPRFFTVDVLDKHKNRTAGWLSMTVTKYPNLQYITNVVNKATQLDNSHETEFRDNVALLGLCVCVSCGQCVRDGHCSTVVRQTSNNPPRGWLACPPDPLLIGLFALLSPMQVCVLCVIAPSFACKQCV